MEPMGNPDIEKLPEGVYSATSEDISRLIAQGRTITATLEITGDFETGRHHYSRVFKKPECIGCAEQSKSHCSRMLRLLSWQHPMIWHTFIELTLIKKIARMQRPKK